MGSGKKQEETVDGGTGQGDDLDLDASDSPRGNEDDKKPFFFCRFVANRPVTSFFAALGGHLLIIVVTTALVMGGYDLFPTNFETLPLQLRDEPWLKRDYAWRYKNNFTPRVTRTLADATSFSWYRSLSKEGVELLYDAGNGNIFTQQNLLKMQEIENALVAVTQYTDYCQLEVTQVCKKPISVLRYFDGTYAAYNSTLNDTSFSNIPLVLYSASVTTETKGDFLYHQANDMTLTSTQVEAGITRTLIPMGYPIENITGTTATNEAIQTFELNYMKPVLGSYESTPEFNFLYYSILLMLGEVQKQAVFDMMLALGSMVFIFGFMCFHTRSLWITSWAVFSILSSFAATNLIYRIVLDFRYFGYFHILAIFIVLGIGADDLFVFYDAWRASGTKSYPSLAHRLWDAYKHSAISMLITSLTTMVAFLASALSPLLGTKTFGIFTAILVVINYLSVIIFFPTVVIVYHLKFEKWVWPCCRCCTKKAEEEKPTALTRPTTKCDLRSGPEDSNGGPLFLKTGSTLSGPSRLSHPAKVTEFEGFEDLAAQPKDDGPRDGTDPGQDEGKKKPSPIVVFFKTYYFDFINHKVWRWVLLAVFVAIIIFFAYYSSKLEPDNEQIQLYKSTHNYARAIKHRLYSFVPNELEAFVQLYLVWGLEEQDLSGCHHSDVVCYGTNGYDSAFDMSDVTAQTAFKALCDEMMAFTDEQVADYKIRRDAVTNNLEIACFTNNLVTFMQSDSAAGSMDMTLPWNWTTTETFIGLKPDQFSSNHFNSSFTRYLDIPVSYWLTNGFQRTYSDDWNQFSSLISEQEDTFTTYALNATDVKVGNRIKYVAVQVNTTLNGQSLGYSEGIPVVERWEAFMQTQLAKMPASLQSGFQVVKTFWHWLYVQKALADNAVMGIAVGICLGFVVLVAATQNIILGFLATLSIGCVTVCVIGVVPLGGWKLGVLVSLNMCLVVGLSVDYVVHLAEGYHMSPHKDRKSRTRDTLESMGISVFGGACTTLGAAMFMLFAEIQFFFQFGIFMFCTIGFSLLFSLGLFTTLTALLGPENDTGDVVVFFRKYVCRRREASTSPASVAPSSHQRAFE